MTAQANTPKKTEQDVAKIKLRKAQKRAIEVLIIEDALCQLEKTQATLNEAIRLGKLWQASLGEDQ